MTRRTLALALAALLLGQSSARAAEAAPEHVVQARQVHLAATLSSAGLKSGQPAGTGTAELVVDVFWNYVTWNVKTDRLEDARGVQIRKVGGATVLALGDTMTGMQKGMPEALLVAIAAKPSDYVLTVTSRKSPEGAVQGALTLR